MPENLQMSLFDCVKEVYAESTGPLENEVLYRRVARKAGISLAQLSSSKPIGKAGALRSPLKRAVRWHQQSLKTMGLIEPSGKRGRWELSGTGKIALRKIRPKASLVGFSTNLGVAVWSLCDDVFTALDAPITLCITSPPYPLRQARAYGNPSMHQYIDFIVDSLRPIARNLERGGSICLNIGHDLFEDKSPARSLYQERLILALADELGLSLMDKIQWVNPSKPPGPTHWACKTRQQLCGTYEPVVWFTNDPLMCKADNRRVLIEHTEKHKKLIASGGERRARMSCDGAHRVREGSFGNQTEGRIPRNVLNISHSCRSQRLYKQRARELGLPPHSAPYPLALATFLIRFLTEPGDLVVDPFGGSLTTGLAAESLERNWVLTEAMWEYLRGGGERFVGLPESELVWNEEFLAVA